MVDLQLVSTSAPCHGLDLVKGLAQAVQIVILMKFGQKCIGTKICQKSGKSGNRKIQGVGIELYHAPGINH